MNTTQAQQKALDDTLFAPVDHLEFEKCNMRFKIDIKPKEATFQVVLDALALTPLYCTFLITADSISRRNKMFWHTARDDTMFTSMRCISRHEKTQVYGTILPKELTDQTMLESKAYQTYYAFAFGEKTPKPKYVRKKVDSDTSPKQKLVHATKEAEQLKFATKRSKKGFRISHASGLVIESWGDSDKEDDDEDDFKDDADNNDDDSDDIDESDDERTESDRDEISDPNLTNVDKTEHEEEDVDERVQTPSDYELTDDEKIHDEENIDEEEEDEVTKKLYDDVNVNLGNDDTEMINVNQDASEQLNAYQLFTTPTPPPHPFFNPLSQQATPTALETTTLLLGLPDFAFVFKFNKRVTNLKKDLSGIKQVDQYAQALSSIPAIVYRYMDNKLREEINKAIQAHNFDCRVEAQAEKREYIELVDSTSLYKVAATLSKFELTKILINNMEKNKSFDVADYKRELYDALIKSYNTDKDIFESYGEVFLLKRIRDERDKDRDPFARSD
nr:hypothetical protein [Tanacetum cinerariifolium]